LGNSDKKGIGVSTIEEINACFDKIYSWKFINKNLIKQLYEEK